MQQKIREQIDYYYKELSQYLDPTTFAYQPGAQKILDKITELQQECHHSYVNGICEYCGKEQDK